MKFSIISAKTINVLKKNFRFLPKPQHGFFPGLPCLLSQNQISESKRWVSRSLLFKIRLISVPGLWNFEFMNLWIFGKLERFQVFILLLYFPSISQDLQRINWKFDFLLFCSWFRLVLCWEVWKIRKIHANITKSTNLGGFSNWT